jgi:hypothetical protein
MNGIGHWWRSACGMDGEVNPSSQQEASMIQNSATRRRPPLSLVLSCSALTVVWWAGLCAYSGRAIWFW